MAHNLSLIRNIRDSDHLYYAEHGEMGGVPDAIGYDTPPHAMKFLTCQDAQAYINTQLPEWARDCHRPVELTASHFTWLGCGITAMLRSGKPIPDRLLAPTPGRLRLWRC